MEFKVWLEAQEPVQGGEEFTRHITPQLAQRLDAKLPGWQNDSYFLWLLKSTVVDQHGAGFAQKDPGEFEWAVLRAADDAARRRSQPQPTPAQGEDSVESNYETCYPGDGFERVVGSHGDPGFDKTGMPAFPVTEVISDPSLKGYYGVHVGDPDDWLDWLVDDGYCDGDIYIYHITVPEGVPFYKTDDENSGGYGGEHGDEEVPSGEVIFSKLKMIPASCIRLEKMITEREYWRDRKRRERNGY